MILKCINSLFTPGLKFAVLTKHFLSKPKKKRTHKRILELVSVISVWKLKQYFATIKEPIGGLPAMFSSESDRADYLC
jgi:hypothetical protein